MILVRNPLEIYSPSAKGRLNEAAQKVCVRVCVSHAPSEYWVHDASWPCHNLDVFENALNSK